MKIIKPSVTIVTDLSDETVEIMLVCLERAGRTCYKSSAHGDPGKFISGIVSRGHESVIEHASITVEIRTDRGVTHELVRHRLGAYSQESTRYVNYAKKEIEYVEPIEFISRPLIYNMWKAGCDVNATHYLEMLKMGCQPQEARSLLNNSLATTIVATYNLREWRHVFKMRCAKEAHAHIKEIMIPLLMYFKKKFVGMFDDIIYDKEFYINYQNRINEYIKEDWVK
jgi:thymidylate synthase (FAD)